MSECDVFVGIDTNTGDPDFLDIYLEGSAGGWVAVGFTGTANMVCRLTLSDYVIIRVTDYQTVSMCLVF